MPEYLERLKSKIVGKQVCIYPMGIAGKAMFDKLNNVGIEVNWFCDKNCDLHGEGYKEVSCLSPVELFNIKDTTIVVIESLYYHEIKNDLSQMGISNILRIHPNKFQIDEFLLKNVDCLNDRVKELKDVLCDEESKKVVERIISAWKMEEVPDDYFGIIFSKNQYWDKSVNRK